ncbi:hypothetical protein ACWEN4_15450 [Streptomyces violaceorubidus]
MAVARDAGPLVDLGGRDGYALAFLVTVGGNIPLNDALARPGDPAALRERFEDPRVAWNAARSALSTLATACLATGLTTRRRPTRPTPGTPGHSTASRVPLHTPGH